MRYLALALALVSTAASAQPDLIVDDLYTDSLCLGPNPYFSVHFTVTNIGDETCEYFCYEKNGVKYALTHDIRLVVRPQRIQVLLLGVVELRRIR